MALRSRYVELANGLDNVRFNGCGAGVAIPSLHMTLWARETDFKHFEIELNVSLCCSSRVTYRQESERRTSNQDAGRSAC